MPSVYSSVLTIRDYANNCADIPWDVAIGLADDLEKEHDRLSDIEQARAHDSRCGELLAKWSAEIAELLEMSKDDEKYHTVGMACLIEAKKQCAAELRKAIAAFEEGK